MTPLKVSYSAVITWRKCQQAYWYSYVERIKPKIREAAPELGTILHDSYLDPFYRGVRDGLEFGDSHQSAMAMLAKEEKRVRALAKTAAMVGADEVARDLRAIVPNALVLATAYHRVHGAEDSKRHPVLVEHSFELSVNSSGSIVLPGRIDLVDRYKKELWLWEHKSTGSVPNQEQRFRDLQTLIYSYAAEELTGKPTAGVIWNYFRTTPPHPPKLLKARKKADEHGGLSMAKDQITTLDLYLAAIDEHKLDPKPYQPLLRHIEIRERQEMFPRFRLPVLGNPKILLRDYVASVEEIETARNSDTFRPIRNVAQHCGWCSFKPLCQAALTGGKTKELKRRLFTHDAA